MNVLVIIPAFNEARSIGRVVGDLPKDRVTEVVVVNNASTDETADNARAAGATVVDERNQGYGFACLRGMAYAATKNPDIIVFLASPESNWIKGCDIVIDGGMSALAQTDALGLA